MQHVIAGCGTGVSQSCSKYMGSSWSGGAVVLLLLIVFIIIAALWIGRRRR